ncbi:MAG: bifunctional hydroxymethylpyrimidine kinase/phosphomethylpyrimidine kinase [Hyphomicrobium sp.]
MTPTRPPIALTIAGSDPSGGAGIQADLKTFTALGVYGASVITALTAQNTVGVSGVYKIPAKFIAEQFEAVTSDLRVSAVKTGMLADVETVTLVAHLLARMKPAHLVVDPVMVATSGDRLVDADAVNAVRTALVPLADVITPNLPEAAALLETVVATSEDQMMAQARQLLALGCKAVLLKGGHGNGPEAVDILITASHAIKFTRPRIATHNTHGTGCTLAAAIAAGLAQQLPLETAVQNAKDFVWSALASGAHLKIGAGSGPVDHLFDLRKTAVMP